MEFITSSFRFTMTDPDSISPAMPGKGGPMKGKARSIERIVEEQVKNWHLSQVKRRTEKTAAPVITISREPGSGGRLLAQEIAREHALDLFHQEVLHKMAASAKVNAQLLETLDERGLNTLENWIASLVHERHLWPDQYLQHLMKVIGIIGKHGGAVVVGRGANYILPPENRFRVRVVAPLEVRVDNVARNFDVSREEAKKRVIRTESDRRAFIRKYFNADISDPTQYDLLINTENISIERAAKTVGSAIGL
jgi:cytidylate kinase